MINSTGAFIGRGIAYCCCCRCDKGNPTHMHMKEHTGHSLDTHTRTHAAHILGGSPGRGGTGSAPSTAVVQHTRLRGRSATTAYPAPTSRHPRVTQGVSHATPAAVVKQPTQYKARGSNITCAAPRETTDVATQQQRK